MAAQGQKSGNSNYVNNQKPLFEKPYIQLPIGAIQPRGMLLKMLELQRDGLTGHLDSIYSVVCGPNNGWLGGAGDCWERGPYWIDGLIPLAYILNDKDLKEKAQKWIEWSIKNQRENGYFGPYPNNPGTPVIAGTQQSNSEDWWPKMVMLKALQQYYSATGDKRVIDLMSGYFRYELDNLTKFPLGHWTFWAEQRGGDNLQMVLWLYNLTGEKYLLDLAEILHKQTFNWFDVLTNNSLMKSNPYTDLHCVNVAQGLKEPVIYYQLHPEEKYKNAVRTGLNALRDGHGFVNGMYGGDEALHGNDPTQGSELCSGVEFMYSFESMLPVTGDLYYADYLEKIAYNVLPTQIDDNYMHRQYFQQVNQVKISLEPRNFDCHYDDGNIFGTTSAYPCCLCNMHQGWPKFVQNLWYATSDNGLAALVYGPSKVKAKVANGTEVEITEETNYPFSGKISFTLKTSGTVEFRFHLRIPGWCKNARVKVNGKNFGKPETGKVLVIDRKWNSDDKVELELPMEVSLSRWFEKSVGIERGPLVYALRVEEEWKEIKSSAYRETYYEVNPKSDWNYGILNKAVNKMDFTVTESDSVALMPWNLANAPVKIVTKAKKIPYWTLVQNSAGKIPYPAYPHRDLKTPEENIVLIPYGCTTLRIAEFPVVDVFLK
ncbi:MAG: glycoside hydrolase family 127 protein [Bacteroidales bacterium]